MAFERVKHEYIPDAESGCCVYFVQQGANGPIKIGRSNFSDIRVRVSSLQVGNPQKINLIGCFAAIPAYELVLHRIFEDARIRGEWYTPTQDLLDIIEMVRNKDIIPLLGMLHNMQLIYGIQNTAPNRRDWGYSHSRQFTKEKKKLAAYIDRIVGA